MKTTPSNKIDTKIEFDNFTFFLMNQRRMYMNS